MTYPADNIADLIQRQMPYGQEPDTTFTFLNVNDPANIASEADFQISNDATKADADKKKEQIKAMQKEKIRISGWLSKHTSDPDAIPGPYLGELDEGLLPTEQRDTRLVWPFGGEPYEIAKAICIPFTFKRAKGHRDGVFVNGRPGYLLIGFVGSGHE